MQLDGPKLALLDRDGVINIDVGAPGVISKSQLVLTSNAGRAVGKLKRAGWNVAMVTNQSCVGKDIISVEELGRIQSRVQQILLHEDCDAHIDKIYQCISAKGQGDYRMKPNPGMVFEALEDFEMTSMRENCCFVGDTSTDLQAAAAAGINNRILVSTGYGKTLMRNDDDSEYNQSIVQIEAQSDGINMHYSTFPFLYSQDLSAAVDWLLL